MPQVRYEGGSQGGLVLDNVPEVFATHPQRELHGDAPGKPYELYRLRGLEGDVHVFEFVSASTDRVLDDDQNYPATAEPAEPAVAEAGSGASA